MIRRQSIPNLLTFARVLAVPVALIAMLAAPRTYSFMLAIFLFASITDFFDGYLARRWNATSALGTMLDPIADKILVAVMLLFLVTVRESLFTSSCIQAQGQIACAKEGAGALMGYTLLIPAALIVARELYMAGLREFLSLRQIALPVSSGGKWKTAVQMLAIVGLLAALAWNVQPSWANASWVGGRALLWIAALLSVKSAIDYTRKAWPALRA